MFLRLLESNNRACLSLFKVALLAEIKLLPSTLPTFACREEQRTFKKQPTKPIAVPQSPQRELLPRNLACEIEAEKVC